MFPKPSEVPDWISQGEFTIEAKAEGEPPALVMVGPMLQRVLEDQFKLKVHRETRVVPVYELVIAKGGPKVTLVEPDTCVEYDFSVSPQPPLAPGQHRCTNHGGKDADGNYVQVMEMMTLQDYFGGMENYGRPIVNKTGISGPVAFRLVQSSHASGPDEALSSFIANLRKDLGLELRPGMDPIDFLIIDHAEKPVFKAQARPVAGSSPARAQGPGR